MNTAEAAERSVRVAAGGALAAAGIGTLGLAGWITGVAGLARWTDASIAISPASASALALLGTAVFLCARWPARRMVRRTAAAVAIGVATLSLLVLAQFVLGFDLGFERPLRHAADSVLDPTAARVSPLTALALLLGTVSLIDRLAFPLWASTEGRAAALLGAGVVAIALMTLACYVLHMPLLYGSAVHPVALPTASGLALLGTALVAAAPTRPIEIEADAPAGSTFRRSGRIRYVPIALAAGAGLLLSLVLATIVTRLEGERLRESFARWADNTAQALLVTIDGTSDGVADVHDFFLGSEDVHRDEFRSFASAGLSRGAEIQALEWVPRVADRQRAAYEAAARAEGVAGFRFTELDARGTLVPAARRAEYYPAYFMQPKQGAPVALGFDLSSEPTRRAALERARDSGTGAASAPITLVLPGHPRGVLLAYPVYRKGVPLGDVAARRAALAGFTVGAVRIGDIVAAVHRLVPARRRSFEIVDVTDPARPATVWADPSASRDRGGIAAVTRTLPVAGRTWEVRLRPTATYLATRPASNAWLVFGSGLLLTLTVAAYLLSLDRSAAEIEAAHEALSESEGRFRAITESAVDAIITIDANGIIRHCNGAALREFGYADGGLVGRAVQDLIPSDLVATHTAGLERYRATGEALLVGEPHELPARRRDGSEFPIELSLAVWETHQGRFATAIIRDITDRKGAQAERERLIAELQDALANVKTLSGLLPVCSWCHKVLDDRGAWRQMEAYVHEHTDADFSHGICPECEKKYLGGEG